MQMHSHDTVWEYIILIGSFSIIIVYPSLPIHRSKRYFKLEIMRTFEMKPYTPEII